MIHTKLKTSLYSNGAIHAVRTGDECYIVHFLTSSAFGNSPPMPPMTNGGDTYAIAVRTSDGTFIVDNLLNFQVLDTP